MKTVKWNGFKIKYNEDEFGNEEEVIEFVEEIYTHYKDVFKNVKTINLTNPDYMYIGNKRYVYYGKGKLDYYSKEDWGF